MPAKIKSFAGATHLDIIQVGGNNGVELGACLCCVDGVLG